MSLPAPESTVERAEASALGTGGAPARAGSTVERAEASALGTGA